MHSWRRDTCFCTYARTVYAGIPADLRDLLALEDPLNLPPESTSLSRTLVEQGVHGLSDRIST
jgi:hypothetical protein